MSRILFVCHGNICRSPMAEFILKELLRERGFESEFEVASAATSAEELGNGVYPPVRRLLEARGIDCSGKRARRLTPADYGRWDLFVGMDQANLRNMRRLFDGDPAGKVRLLHEFGGIPGEVEDPWYTGEFKRAEEEIRAGCSRLLDWLLDGRKNA
ncbi:MAG: low molecular weight phosphotyrosine protein phosphatase [Lentisphaeria bacterium]|nr:low molecular weight phosphotyrosine protein phosphatase [Lentisphaeria bacterium]